MSRCVICDHSSEIDYDGRSYSWSEQENGYVCGRCDDAIKEANAVFDEILPAGELPNLVEPGILEIEDLADYLPEAGRGGKGGDTDPQEDEDICTDGDDTPA